MMQFYPPSSWMEWYRILGEYQASTTRLTTLWPVSCVQETIVNTIIIMSSYASFCVCICMVCVYVCMHTCLCVWHASCIWICDVSTFLIACMCVCLSTADIRDNITNTLHTVGSCTLWRGIMYRYVYTAMLMTEVTKCYLWGALWADYCKLWCARAT